MIELECACDGGKDSLSMAAAAGGETVMAPGNLVVSAYVGCPDITKVVTPDLKLAAAGGVLLHVDLASVPGARRLGGSALAQAYNQIGDDCPDVQPGQLKAAWGAVQSLIDQGLVSAGHDISDGGIATTLLEMAFAGRLVLWMYLWLVLCKLIAAMSLCGNQALQRTRHSRRAAGRANWYCVLCFVCLCVAPTRCSLLMVWSGGHLESLACQYPWHDAALTPA